tara:strand:+ start:238 stop:519 length:282 start_codon:yes stop_codon:yes gene_type:complete
LKEKIRWNFATFLNILGWDTGKKERCGCPRLQPPSSILMISTSINAPIRRSNTAYEYKSLRAYDTLLHNTQRRKSFSKMFEAAWSSFEAAPHC